MFFLRQAMGHTTIIVIPCYNEARRLGPRRFLAFIKAHPLVKLIFVDDGSTDDTLNILKSIKKGAWASCDIIRFEQNRGKGEAVRQGILSAYTSKPDYVGYWDADLSTPLASIPIFVELLEGRPSVYMVFGARVQLLGKMIERSAMRHYLGRIFATIVSAMLNLKVYDTQCGAKLFRATDEIGRIFSAPFISRWIFDVEIIARWKGLQRVLGLPEPQRAIFEYPLPVWRHVADSKIRMIDCLAVARDLLKIKKSLSCKTGAKKRNGDG
jgi:glycosyltransferase involved in cell wall biosynthesis